MANGTVAVAVVPTPTRESRVAEVRQRVKDEAIRKRGRPGLSSIRQRVKNAGEEAARLKAEQEGLEAQNDHLRAKMVVIRNGLAAADETLKVNDRESMPLLSLAQAGTSVATQFVAMSLCALSHSAAMLMHMEERYQVG